MRNARVSAFSSRTREGECECVRKLETKRGTKMRYRKDGGDTDFFLVLVREVERARGKEVDEDMKVLFLFHNLFLYLIS